MTPKRKYLREHDQFVTITIEGPSGVGKTVIAEKLAAIFESDGCVAVVDSGRADRIRVRSRSVAEERAAYLEGLRPQDRDQLMDHLAAMSLTP